MTPLDTNTLPDDPTLLKQLLVDLQLQAQEGLSRIRREADDEIARLKAEYQAALVALFRRYYGPRSETFDPRQLLLFGEQVASSPLDEVDIAEEAGEELITRRIVKKHPHGRQILPDDLRIRDHPIK